MSSRVSASARTQPLALGVGWGLALILASLPFELYAGLSLGGLTFTNLEMLVLAVLALWGLGLAIERRLPRVPRLVALAALGLLAIFFVSAAAAPEWRLAALKFSARQAQGALLALCLADQLATWGRPLARRLGLALLAGAAVSATFGLLEITEAPPILALLAIFKEQPTMAGGLLRLSATFAYANIAAMYYEAALPIGLVAVGLTASRPARLLLAGAALLLLGATLLTYSRAALLTVIAAIVPVMLGALWLRRRAPDTGANRSSWRGGARSIGAVARPARYVVRLCVALLVLTAGVLLLNPAIRVRIVAPDVAEWYRADYSVARLPGLAPNELVTTQVAIQNRGLVAWRPAGLRPVALSYHWLDPHTRRVVRYNGRRTLLPQPIEPGGALLLAADVQAPEKPGDYILAWDLVVEHSGWFSERGNPMAEVAVTVAGQPAVSRPAPPSEPANMPQQISIRPAPPARDLLWGAAVRMWRARPLLGIGPDVFRHAYGPQLGLLIWDDRLHTNSLYLELLVGTGVAGLAAFALLVGLALRRAAGVLVQFGRPTTDDRRPTMPLSSIVKSQSSAELALVGDRDARVWMALGCAVALLTFLIHGVLDMFLEYSATNLLLWALIGALGGLTLCDGGSHAQPEHIR
jgi:hypothetical protein